PRRQCIVLPYTSLFRSNTSIAQHRDVHQTVFARQDVYEGAEINNALNLTDIDLADFSFSSDAQNALPSGFCCVFGFAKDLDRTVDRKSTRLNSSHVKIS